MFLFSKGYRIDFSSMSLTKTGDIYIKSIPEKSEIFIDGEKIEPSRVIARNGLLVGSLIPKKYRLELKKDGYLTYVKNIEVKESMVTQLLNVILIPEEIELNKLSESVKGDKIIAISKENNNLITYDSEYENYYLCSLTAISNCNNITSERKTLLKQSILDIAFYPSEKNVFVVFTKDAVYRMDIENKSASKIKDDAFDIWFINGNNLYLAEKKDNKKDEDNEYLSSIVVIDLSLKKEIERINLPFEIAKISEIKASKNYISVILEDGELFLINNSDKKMQKIATSAKESIFSPGETKMLYQDIDGKVFIYMLEDDEISLNATEEDKIKLWIADSESIKNIKWSDEYHLVIEYPNKINFAEVDYRAFNNQFSLYKNTGEDEINFFSTDKNTLYIKKAGTIFYYKLNK